MAKTTMETRLQSVKSLVALEDGVIALALELFSIDLANSTVRAKLKPNKSQSNSTESRSSRYPNIPFSLPAL